jgi:hypothetical protein
MERLQDLSGRASAEGVDGRSQRGERRTSELVWLAARLIIEEGWKRKLRMQGAAITPARRGAGRRLSNGYRSGRLKSAEGSIEAKRRR